MQLIIATSNPHKLREIKKIIATYPELNLDVHSILKLNIPEPNEPHQTFMENAKHKAKYYADKTKFATLSEDTGLCINALEGFPGVRTKEFVGECGSLNKAFAKLEQMLHDAIDYTANFICAATIYIPQEDHYICFEATIPGRISFPARGTDGFGFDPIYIPDGYTKTMAELGENIKNQIGHRGKAIRGVMQALLEYS